MDKKQPMTFILRALHLFIWLLIIWVFFMIWPLLQPVIDKIWAVLIPVLIAALFAYILHPFIEGIHKWGLPRLAAILLIFAGFIGLIILIVIYGIPMIAEQIQEAMEILPSQMTKMVSYVHTWEYSLERMPTFLKGHIDDWSVQLLVVLEKLFDQVEGALIRLAQSIPSLVVIPFLIFYFLKDVTLIKKSTWYLTPPKWRRSLSYYAKDVDHTFGSYIRGQLLVASVVAVLSMIGLWLLGVPYAILFGLFIGATDIIPYFGAIIGAAPAIVAALLISWDKGLYTVILLVVIQQIEGNLLSPLIVGRTLHLHPMLIVLALLVGVEMGGILGLLVAVPALAVLKVTLLHIRQHFQND